ncbi:L-arabinose isomerase, partial [Marivirga lumbricoides]
RLVFNVASGPAVNVSLIDMGNRFRLLINEVEAVTPPHDLPNLPVARVLWDTKPNLKVAASAWIYGGGAHHTVFSKSLPTEVFEDFAEMAGIETLIIDSDTTIRGFKETLKWNEVYYQLFQNKL